MAKKKITLDGLANLIKAGFTAFGKRFANLEARVDKGFAAVADDFADMRKDVATKDQMFSLHTQVNSIETQLRGMKREKLATRVADLEEKVT